MPEIKFENVSFSFEKNKHEKVPVLEDFSLNIESGKITVIMGDSGSGKTTILRLIAGLIEPVSGRILLNGCDSSEIKAKDRSISYVHEGVTNYPHLTGFRNIAFPLMIAGANGDEIRRRVFEAAKEVKIEDYLQFKPKQLSLGQNQRISIARAIVKNSDLFLFDEMCSGLGEDMSFPLLRDIKEIVLRHNSTAVFVTHYAKEAFLVGDRIIVLKEGKIIGDGTPKEIIESENQDIKDIIGFIDEVKY